MDRSRMPEIEKTEQVSGTRVDCFDNYVRMIDEWEPVKTDWDAIVKSPPTVDQVIAEIKSLGPIRRSDTYVTEHARWVLEKKYHIALLHQYGVPIFFDHPCGECGSGQVLTGDVLCLPCQERREQVRSYYGEYGCTLNPVFSMDHRGWVIHLTTTSFEYRGREDEFEIVVAQGYKSKDDIMEVFKLIASVKRFLDFGDQLLSVSDFDFEKVPYSPAQLRELILREGWIYYQNQQVGYRLDELHLNGIKREIFSK